MTHFGGNESLASFVSRRTMMNTMKLERSSSGGGGGGLGPAGRSKSMSTASTSGSSGSNFNLSFLGLFGGGSGGMNQSFNSLSLDALGGAALESESASTGTAHASFHAGSYASTIGGESFSVERRGSFHHSPDRARSGSGRRKASLSIVPPRLSSRDDLDDHAVEKKKGRSGSSDKSGLSAAAAVAQLFLPGATATTNETRRKLLAPPEKRRSSIFNRSGDVGIPEESVALSSL